MSKTSTVHKNERQQIARLPLGDRQTMIKNLFIDHDRFSHAMRAVKSFHIPVEGGVPDFGSLRLLAGEPRTGKTVVLNRYADQFPPEQGPKGMIRRVIYVDMPESPAVRSMAEQIADALNTPYTLRKNTHGLVGAVLNDLRDQEVELLIFDEAQDVLNVKQQGALKAARTLFRKILNLRTLNICIAGLPETYHIAAKDKQLKGRGMLRYHIVHPYSWDSAEERLDFRLLCDLIDDGLPFNERSGLGTPAMAQRLYYVSDGIIGLLKDMVFNAACLALNAGAQKVDAKFFAEAWDQCKPIGVPFNPFIHDMANAPTRTPAQEPASPENKSPDASMFQRA